MPSVSPTSLFTGVMLTAAAFTIYWLARHLPEAYSQPQRESAAIVALIGTSAFCLFGLVAFMVKEAMQEIHNEEIAKKTKAHSKKET